MRRKSKNKGGFKCSYDRIPKGDVRKVIDGLKEILNVKTDANVYTYIRGDREPKMTQAIEIERLFAEYGIEMNWHCNEPELQEEL